MLLTILWSFLLALFRFLLAASLWGDVAGRTTGRSPVQQVPFVIKQPLRNAAIVGDSLVVLSGKEDWGDRRLVVSTSREGDRTLAALSLSSAYGPEAFVARGGGWWYATTRQPVEGQATLFISDNGSGNVETNVVHHPEELANFESWIPVKGGEPRVLLALQRAQGFDMTEIDSTGPLRTWHLDRTDIVWGREGAEFLPDGRIALMTYSRRPDKTQLLLFGNFGWVEKIDLSDAWPGVTATAVDSSGDIALVSGGGDLVVGAVFNPAHPMPLIWHWLANLYEPNYPNAVNHLAPREVRVTAVRDGFVVAWVTHPHAARPRLYARELKAGYMGAWSAEIAAPANSREIFFDMQTSGGEVRFYWDDGRNLVTRQLPASVSGFQLVQWLGEWCNAF